MRSMGVKIVRHPSSPGVVELYLQVCYKYQKKYIRIGPDTKKNRALANNKAQAIRNKIAEQGHTALNKLFNIKSAAPTLRQFLGKNPDEKKKPEDKEFDLGEWGKQPGWYQKAKKSLKYSTYHGYVNLIKQRLLPKYGDIRIDAFDREEFENYLFALSEDKLSYRTICNIKNLLSGILETAKPKWIRENPIHGVIVPKINPDAAKEEINPFTWDDRETLEQAVLKHRPRYYALIATGFRAGLRMGELIGLRVSDLDMINGVINVRHNITRGRGTTPKSEAGRRKVRITRELKEILSRQITAVKEEALKKAWKAVPEWVFVNEQGNKVGYGNFVARVWNPCMDKSKLARRTPHDMRHTYATMRLSMGHSIQEVAKEMGHSTPMVTYKTYYHWIPAMSTSNIDMLDSKYARNPTRELLEKKGEKISLGVSSEDY